MGLTRDERLPDQRKILAVQRVELPRYRREGAVEVRPFTAKTRLRASEAQGLSGEAVKGNPPTTVIPRVDESKITPEELSEPAPIAILSSEACPIRFNATQEAVTLGRFSISSLSGEVFASGNVGDQKMPARILV